MTRGLLRYRYLILTAWGVAWAVAIRLNNPTHSDYGFFLAGGKILTGGHMRAFSGNPLDLYAQVPGLQIGPPPLLAAGVLQRLVPDFYVSAWIWAMLIVACGLVTVWAVERTARAVTDDGYVDRVIVPFGMLLLAGWASLQSYVHLDDALAVMAVALAVMLVAQADRRWWLGPLLLGVAAAGKPWAVVALPLALAAPKQVRVKAFGVGFAAAAVWWAPFVIYDRDTVHQLLNFEIIMRDRASTYPFWHDWLYLYPSHLHALMMVVGAGLCAWAVLRGRWLVAPAVAFGARMLLDQNFNGYYAVGPLVGAVLVDVSRRHRFPGWTVAVLVVEFGLQQYASPKVGALAQLVLSLALVGSLFGGNAKTRPASDTGRGGVEAERERQVVTSGSSVALGQ